MQIENYLFLLTNRKLCDNITITNTKLFERSEEMKLNRIKVSLIMAKKSLTIADIAHDYNATKQRVSCILNSVNITPKTAGKLAKALGVDVTEIIEIES